MDLPTQLGLLVWTACVEFILVLFIRETSVFVVIRNEDSFTFMNDPVMFLRLWPSEMSCETPT